MRRDEREISESSAIESIIQRSTVCRLALCSGNRPYIIPLCFGYQDNTFYFHSALEGKKIDIIKENNNVCFELDIDNQIMEGAGACDWTMKYRSVIGFGKASLLEKPDLKRQAFAIIMKHYSKKSFAYKNTDIDKIIIIKVDIIEMTGKQSGY